MKSLHTFRILAFSLFVLLGTSLWGQGYEPIAAGKARVISLDGLILREGPGKDQQRLAAIPYGASLEVLKTTNPKLDSIAPIQNYSAGIDDPPEAYWMSRVGYWVKVKWNGKQGYALDIFLLSEEEYLSPREILDQALPANLNTDFLLFEVGSACQTNLPPDARYTWYGVYRFGNKLKIKPVALKLHASRKDEVVPGQLFLHTLADDNLGLEYIVGARTAMGVERSVDLIHAYGMEFEQEMTEEQRAAYFQKMGIRFVPYKENASESLPWPRLVVTSSKGAEQVLTIADMPLDGDPWLRLVADIDGDGKQDYVVTYGESSSTTVLYLSSRASKGNHVQAVAVWFSSYCC